MADQATVDIPAEATPEITPVKKGFFRRLFDISFFPIIWCFSPTLKTLDYLAQSSSWVIVDLLPNLLSPFLLSGVTLPFYAYVVYKPILAKAGRVKDGGSDYYGLRYFIFAFITAIYQFISFPLVGLLISFLTWEKITIRHTKFYQSAFTALIPASLAFHWCLNVFDKSPIPVWELIPAVSILFITVSMALVFMKTVTGHGVKYKCALLEILHFTAIMGTVGGFIGILVALMNSMGSPDN